MATLIKGTNKLILGPGDLIISQEALPSPANIVELPHFVESLGYPLFNVEELNLYLNFLEAIVINDKIFSAVAFKYSDYTNEQYWLPCSFGALPELREQFKNELEDKILFKGSLPLKKPLHVFFTPFLSQLPSLWSKIEGVSDIDYFLKNPDSQKSNESFWRLLQLYADPLYISEFAFKLNIPYYLSNHEVKNIELFEELERLTYKNVKQYLYQKLNDNSRKELHKLEQFGEKTIYPETPIAWLIIRDSIYPEDLLKVALQYRIKFKKFREAMISMDNELTSQTTSLEKKLKILKEIEFIAQSFWGKEDGVKMKIASELPNLIGSAAETVSCFSISSSMSLLNSIISMPIDLLLNSLRKKKIRVILKAKKDFLKSRNWVQKLSSLFSINETIIKECIDKSKLNT